ncbi:MAG: aminoacetone oxidase family FAD-binding enzyme [Planctomycetes bacterium]|nr:aminoacetone oxidase family FAD-binding enzyme [Planctomycetota bacterium]
MAAVDVVVLGAGAAGLMAAIRSAESGAGTVLLEKNRKPGVKILASGGGRCNLTTTREGSELLGAFPKPQRRWLTPSLRAFPPRRLRAWFEERGVALQEEAMEKVFPVAGCASVVLEALVTALAASGAELRCRAPVREVARGDGGFVVTTPDGEVRARRVVLAVGGKSYPKTGTVGDGYGIARALGHTISSLRPGLAGLVVDDPHLRALAGLTIEDAAVHWMVGDRRITTWRRPVLFTHTGLSGPGPMNFASVVEESGGGKLAIDLMPDASFEEVESGLLDRLRAAPRRGVVASLPTTLPERLRQALVHRAGVGADVIGATLTREHRRRLGHLLKGLEVDAKRSTGWDHAEVTCGGVVRDEVDPKTMASRSCRGLFLCGEILDVDGPIGGYNFQAAFATGWVAGGAAAR